MKYLQGYGPERPSQVTSLQARSLGKNVEKKPWLVKTHTN